MSVLTGMQSRRPRVRDSLVDVLRGHADIRPDQIAFSFLLKDGAESVLTSRELDRRARALAAHLQQMGLSGERVILAYHDGLEFISGFFGGLCAGCAAVPTSLPHRRTLDRFLPIAADSGARLRFFSMINHTEAQIRSTVIAVADELAKL